MTGVIVLGVVVGAIAVGTVVTAGVLRVFERMHRR